MTICPACGQPIISHRVPVEALTAAPMSPVRRTIIAKLVERYPLDVSADALLFAVYSGAREPEFARQALSVQLHNIRLILKPYGWTVPQAPGGRGNTAMYRLEPLP